MNVDLHRLLTARGRVRPLSSEPGFSALEFLVIVVIVCAVVAIGVPTLHARARVSVLESNLEILGTLVVEKAMEGYSPEYRATGEGDPAKYLSTHLEEDLEAMGNSGYVNPMVGSEGGRLVLSSSTVPTDPNSVPPAVFITDSPQCHYLVFGAQPEQARQLLAGTLIVAFNPQARTVDVFYVDESGHKSAHVVSVPLR